MSKQNTDSALTPEEARTALGILLDSEDEAASKGEAFLTDRERQAIRQLLRPQNADYEWGIQWPTGQVTRYPNEEEARQALPKWHFSGDEDGVLVRRPVGAWEVQ